jgi:hypothetical protein
MKNDCIITQFMLVKTVVVPDAFNLTEISISGNQRIKVF